jgi:hypothetical protein
MWVCLHTEIHKDNHKHKIYVTTGITLTDTGYYNQYSAKFLTMKISKAWNNKTIKKNKQAMQIMLLLVQTCNNIFKQADLNC